MIFKDIKIGTEVLYNGHYAVKVKPDCIQIPRLGLNGFFHIREDENIEVINEKENE